MKVRKEIDMDNYRITMTYEAETPEEAKEAREAMKHIKEMLTDEDKQTITEHLNKHLFDALALGHWDRRAK